MIVGVAKKEPPGLVDVGYGKWEERVRCIRSVSGLSGTDRVERRVRYTIDYV